LKSHLNHQAQTEAITKADSASVRRGVDGEEVQDEGFAMANARRRSNSSSYTAGLKDFKTKFETIEQEPVFENDIHGPGEDSDDLHDAHRVNTESSDGSLDDDEKVKSL
jgi:hypothetical protein